jgi:hypothetical protein
MELLLAAKCWSDLRSSQYRPTLEIERLMRGTKFPPPSSARRLAYCWPSTIPAANLPGTSLNYLSAAPAGGNTNEFVARGDQNIGNNTHVIRKICLLRIDGLGQ